MSKIPPRGKPWEHSLSNLVVEFAASGSDIKCIPFQDNTSAEKAVRAFRESIRYYHFPVRTAKRGLDVYLERTDAEAAP